MGTEQQPDGTKEDDPSRDYILVFHINDSTDDQVLFQAACKRAGIPVNWHVADSASKGVSYLETLVRKSKEHDVLWPDLVLLDIIMSGSSGFEVLRYMRATPELRNTPVIIFTAFSDKKFQEEARALGANWFIAKPTVFERTVEIARAIYEFCREGRPMEASLI